MQGSFIDRILDLFMPLFSHWGYALVFGGVFLESLFLTGWVAPGTTVVLLASFYAAHGELNVFMVAATAAVAALLGDLVGFLIGSRLGIEVLERYGERPRLRRGMDKGQHYFRRFGAVTVLVGRMLSGVDAFIPLIAGLNAMPLWKYLRYDLGGISLWTALLVSLGYFFGANWRAIDRVIDALGWGLLAVLAVAVALHVMAGRRRKGKATGEP